MHDPAGRAPFEVNWDPARALLTTRVKSPITIDEVVQYKESLGQRIAGIPAGTIFVWLSSAIGYDAFSNRAAHQEMRSVVPLTLAAHGFRTSLLDLFEGTEIRITRTRDVECRAVAHVHQDEEKMRVYDERFGRPNERYFTDESLALAWLLQQ
jgi:hypothetical protein